MFVWSCERVMVLKLIKLMSLAKLLRPERQATSSLSKASRNRARDV